jgi:hypothetical protein
VNFRSRTYILTLVWRSFISGISACSAADAVLCVRKLQYIYYSLNYFLFCRVVMFEPIPTLQFSLTLEVSAINLLLCNTVSMLVSLSP